MYHCTLLARDKEMVWVDEGDVKRWEEGLRMEYAVNLKHKEAIDLAMKIINDPGKVTEYSSEVENVSINGDISKDEELTDENINVTNLKDEEYATDEDRTLFVGDLPPEVTADVLQGYFGTFGEIEEVKRKREGKPCGHGFILFKDISSVKKARDQAEHFIMDKIIRIGKAKKGIKRLIEVKKEEKRGKNSSNSDINRGAGSGEKIWNRRKFGIERGHRISYEQRPDPVIIEDQSRYSYPHCPGPKRSTGFGDD